MEIKQIITELSQLDLSKYPENEIKHLFSQMGRIGFIQTILHPEHVIVRARPNDKARQFGNRADLSYKPQEFNKTYQRASTPSQTMFYGGIVPPNSVNDLSGNTRFASAFEASQLIRNDEDGFETLTFSKWKVVKDIPLITMCHHQDFLDKNPHLLNLHKAYEQFLATTDNEVANNSMEITSYLAKEYAKNVKHGDDNCNYMISAIFSEMSLRKTNQGIYFPSVQTSGLGFNVAITPEATDSSLKLIGVSECTIYKHGKEILVDNETTCEIIDDTKSFELKPIAKEYHLGKEESLRRVGLGK